MTASNFYIQPFDLRNATPEQYSRLNDFKNILRLEVYPDDPPVPVTEETERLKALPAIDEAAAWAIWHRGDGRMMGLAVTHVFHTGDNEHLIDFNIEVLPDFRRMGLARRLLRLVAGQARSHGRRLLIAESNDRVPASAEFLARMGGRRGLDEPLNQLLLADLDRALVEEWLHFGDRLAPEFSLGFWDGRYPDESIQAISDLMQVVANDEPRESLEIEDEQYSPELLRHWEGLQLSGGQRKWTLYAAERGTARLVGLTEVVWNPNRPTILRQGFTGVLPEHRNRGVGRWLKASMLSKILSERPELRIIRTGNAASNAPMLKVNQALGFKPFIAWVVWQADLDAVEKYLVASS